MRMPILACIVLIWLASGASARDSKGHGDNKLATNQPPSPLHVAAPTSSCAGGPGGMGRACNYSFEMPSSIAMPFHVDHSFPAGHVSILSNDTSSYSDEYVIRLHVQVWSSNSTRVPTLEQVADSVIFDQSSEPANLTIDLHPLPGDATLDGADITLILPLERLVPVTTAPLPPPPTPNPPASCLFTFDSLRRQGTIAKMRSHSAHAMRTAAAFASLINVATTAADVTIASSLDDFPPMISFLNVTTESGGINVQSVLGIPLLDLRDGFIMHLTSDSGDVDLSCVFGSGISIQTSGVISLATAEAVALDLASINPLVISSSINATASGKGAIFVTGSISGRRIRLASDEGGIVLRNVDPVFGQSMEILSTSGDVSLNWVRAESVNTTLIQTAGSVSAIGFTGNMLTVDAAGDVWLEELALGGIANAELFQPPLVSNNAWPSLVVDSLTGDVGARCVGAADGFSLYISGNVTARSGSINYQVGTAGLDGPYRASSSTGVVTVDINDKPAPAAGVIGTVPEQLGTAASLNVTASGDVQLAYASPTCSATPSPTLTPSSSASPPSINTGEVVGASIGSLFGGVALGAAGMCVALTWQRRRQRGDGIRDDATGEASLGRKPGSGYGALGETA